MGKAFIGIGSNVDREQNIRSGLREIAGLGTMMSVSSVYESKAYGFEGDNFYNLAIGLETDTSPHTLNDILREIEDRHGRERNVPRFSSRSLDLDLLLYDDLVCHDGNLEVPRADIVNCAFVLGPLVEIAGDIRHPESGVRIRDIWASFNREDQEIWVVGFDTGIRAETH